MIDISNKKILDATCGSRSIWFNKNHPAAVYCDKREEEFELAFGKARTSVRKIVEKKHNILGMFYEDRGNRTRAVQRW